MRDCADNIDASSPDIYEYILANTPSTVESIESNEYACYKPVDSHWLIVYGPLLYKKEYTPSSLGYLRIPKLYGLSEMPDTTSMDRSQVTGTLNIPSLGATGRGVIIGIIDTGIDYLLSNFVDAAGSSRIGTLWDQTNDYTYTNNDINIALEAYRDGEDPYEYVDSHDEDGHGTFVAGIAASSYVDGYFGVAPESELAVVKLRMAQKYLREYYCVYSDKCVYSEADVMLAVHFLKEYAASKSMPLVLMCGLTCAQGARNGTSPLCDVLNTLTKADNTVVVTSVGNEAMARTHYRGQISSISEPDVMEVNVSGESEGFVLEIWAQDLDTLSIAVVSPSGEMIPRMPLKSGETYSYVFLYEKTELHIDYSRTEALAGSELILLRFLKPASGIWRIYTYGLDILSGRFDAWLPLVQFMSGDVTFIQSCADTTLTEPSSANRVISVGAYNHYTDSLYAASGRGYDTNGRIKPDIVAPGVDIYGPAAANNRIAYTRKSGTSIAAAHVAGAAALMLSWGVTGGNSIFMGNNEVKAMLIRGASRQAEQLYPNKLYGYGKLDVLESFNQLRIK